MKWLEHRIPPPLVMLFIAGLMGAAAWFVPGPRLSGIALTIAASIIALLGLLVAGAGVRSFGRAKTTINPVDIDAASTLVTTGIFAYTRNPMYVGMVLILIGWAIFLGSPWLVGGPIVFMAFIGRFQIYPEERLLATKFGQPYAAYRHAVRRWI